MNIHASHTDHLLAAELRVLFVLVAKELCVEQEARLQAAGIELSHLQLIMLRILNHDGGKTISELSKIIMCDPSTLVPSSEGLVRKGYLHRVRDPQDRRRVLLYITPKVTEVFETIDTMPEDDLILTCVRQMGSENAQQLHTHLRQIVTSLPGGETTYEHIRARIHAQMDTLSQSDAQTPAQTAEQSEIRE